MTTVYGVTGYGAKLQIAKQLKDIDEFPQDKVNEGKYILTIIEILCRSNILSNHRVVTLKNPF